MPLDNGGQIRFMAENLLQTGVRSVSLSSEDAGFTYENALTNFRSRPFKFTGRFEITSDNNKLYFNDGANKTATIAVGEYLTRASLASAIQTAMNAVGSGFIVTWSSTVKKFVINGTARVLQLSNQTNAIWETIGFVTLTNTASATAHTAEEQRLHWPYEFIKIDFGYYPEIGFFALIADATKPLNITPMANVIIEANTIDDFTSPPVSINLTRADRGFFKFFDDDDYNYRFWRIRIEDNFAENEIEIGHLYLGEFTKLKAHYNDQGGVNSNEDRSDVNESESGQIYSFDKTKQRTYDSISLQAFDVDDLTYMKDIFNRIGLGKPFFISIDPKLEITKTLDDATFFCRIDQSLKFTHITRNLYNTDFKVIEWL
jgi:hypothetical protein